MGSGEGNIVFPCTAVPQEPDRARLVGLYPQRQEGRWMQRTKLLGGRLTASQWSALADIVGDSASESPLHLTTRQDIELHDLTGDQVPVVQSRLADAGLTTVGACGDTLRNITICPCSGALDGTVDLGPLAWQIRAMLEATEGIFAMPRKFKISLSACPEARAQPWINDLGFVATQEDGRWGFQATVGGSLGARPGAAILLSDFLPADEVPSLVAAAIRIFMAHGDRQNRRRARLRHVRERIGDAALLEMLQGAHARVKAERKFPAPQIPVARNGFHGRLALTFPNGDVTAVAARELAGLAARDDVLVRIDNHHHVILFGPDEDGLRQAVARCASLKEAARGQATVVACPGTRWCSRALTDTNALADRIRSELGEVLPAGTTVCISGCPNGCSQAAVADVGLTGALSGGDNKQQCYNLWVGGGMGRDDRLARPLVRKLAADEVISEIRSYLAGAEEKAR